MNKIKILILIALPILFFSACEKKVTTDDLSRVTYFANFTLEGDETIVLPCGTEFVEPGVSAEENGNQVDVSTTIGSGTYFGAAGIDANVADIYSISYSAINSDGFPGSASRSVYVACNGDMVNSIEGFYTSQVTRGSASPRPGLNYVIINKLEDNKYQLSHAIGGYYDLGSGYGPNYAALGSIISFDGSAYSVTDGQFPVWGNVVVVSDFTVDAASKTISYHGSGNFGNGEFDVLLKQVEL